MWLQQKSGLLEVLDDTEAVESRQLEEALSALGEQQSESPLLKCRIVNVGTEGAASNEEKSQQCLSY